MDTIQIDNGRIIINFDKNSTEKRIFIKVIRTGRMLLVTSFSTFDEVIPFLIKNKVKFDQQSLNNVLCKYSCKFCSNYSLLFQKCKIDFCPFVM